MLDRLPLFQELGAGYRRSLLKPSTVHRFAAGAELFRQGDVPEHLYLLLEGAVELRGADRLGNEAIVEVVHPPDCFILAAVVTGAPLLMGARALEASRLLLIPADHLRDELHREPALGLCLLGAMAGQYRGMVRQIKDLKLRTSTERLAAFLVNLAREQADTAQLQLPYPKRVLADRMGVTPEHLSRAFARLRERGVQIQGSRVVIDDLNRLAAFSRVDLVLDAVDRELRVPGNGH